VPEVVLTLQGSSWLAGTYQGYEEFSQYVLGARHVLESAGKPITYLHHDDQMTVVHDFLVGGSAISPEMPLRVTVSFDPDGRVTSLLIEPGDQDVFDAAVQGYLLPRRLLGEAGRVAQL
jgi:hypothetical protein